MCILMERFEQSKKIRHRKRYMAEEWYEKHKKMAKRTKVILLFSEQESVAVDEIFDLFEKQPPCIDREGSEEILNGLVKGRFMVTMLMVDLIS